MKSFKSHFKFSKQERSGIFFLLLFLVIVQVVRFFIQENGSSLDEPLLLDKETQIKIDALKKEQLKKDTLTIYPFNPNFISDYKGYTLGMNIEEIDRLHRFRATNKWVNSAKEFQGVTKISAVETELVCLTQNRSSSSKAESRCSFENIRNPLSVKSLNKSSIKQGLWPGFNTL